MKKWMLGFSILFLSMVTTVGTVAFYYPVRDLSLVWLFIFIALSSFIYGQFYKEIKALSHHFTSKKRSFILLSAAILAFLLLMSTKGTQLFLQDNSMIVRMFVYVTSYILSFTTLAWLIIKLSKISDKKEEPKKVSNLFFILYFIILASSGLFYFISYYPAAMSPDSLSSWAQAHTQEYHNWHPIMFTWLIMLLSKIWNSPAIVSLFQILSLAGILSYGFVQLQKLGVNKAVLIITSIIIAIIPSYGIYNIIIWKDVLFSASLLLFTIHLFLIVYSNGQWLGEKSHVILFVLSSFGVVFLRHNGYPVFILTILVLLFFYRKKVAKVVVPIFITMITLQILLTGPVFAWLDVKPSDPNEALSIPTQQIAHIIKSEGNLTEEQLAYYDRILPIEIWKEKYLPHTVDPIKFSWADYDRDVIFDDFGKYVRTWGEIVVQNPGLAFEAFKKHTALVWQMSTPQYGYTATYITVIMGNDYGLENKMISQPFTTMATSYLEGSLSVPYKFVWRPAFYAFLILLFSVILIVKNGYRSIVITLPFLLNMLSVLAAMPAQDFRYLFANVLISFIIPLMALVNPKNIEVNHDGI
ncbi:DUF6020 family protein [Bacillus timonensis]|nr:DUF6020 family protein [Bacillus timonensis]